MSNRTLARVLTGFAAFTGLLAAHDAAAQSARALDVRAQQVIEHWTPDRRAGAIPRDLVIDERGLGYLRHPGGGLEPYGHNIAAQAGPPGGGDSTGPSVGNLNPANGATIGASHTFSATVSDPSGVKSVSFKVRKGSGPTQSFTPGSNGAGLYSVALSGFTDGAWSWYVVATDNTKRGGNTTTTNPVNFTVDTGGGGGGGGGTVPNSEWTSGGTVQNAAGRIYFEMPSNPNRTRWGGYVCSGTVVTDGTTGRSTILTAAHCVYDDANKAFARNVLFIPNQADTTGTGTDRVCSNDPIGCWVPNFGVVDVNWTNRTFPDNVAWDYAFYVVNDTGAHQAGFQAASNQLDAAVAPMSASFSAPAVGTVAHALGYSYDVDPQFMYCTDPLENRDSANWWLPNCGLSGGSSGGPWVQPMGTNGNGPVFSVNSWGFTNSPGMAGPKLSGTSASCVFSLAKSAAFGTFTAGNAGYTFSGSCP